MEHKTSGKGELCGQGFLHCYSDPLLAAFLHPLHIKFEDPVLWEAEGSGVMKDDHGLKMGFSCLKTVKKMQLPVVTREQRIAFGILCVLKVDKNEEFVKWSMEWLSGEDRSRNSAYEVWSVTRDMARSAAISSAWSPHSELDAASSVAYMGVDLKSIDLVAIAKEAMKY